jgi:MtrB/PioB family decaheme-associated outer membrane protein
MNHDKRNPLPRRAIGLTIASALASLACSSAWADPVLTARLVKDTDILFRDADMVRWSDNYIELGVGNNTQQGYRFGQFSGLKDKGGFPIAGFNWLSRDDNNDARYWHVFGSTLGLDSRKLHAEGGVQGSWKLDLGFDQLSKALTTPNYFIHNGLGTSNLTLPAGFAVNNGVSGNAANLNAALKKFDLEQTRDIFRIGLSSLASSSWDWKVSFREDRRDGARLTGLYTPQSKGMLVPYQIDDRTSIVDAILSYNSKLAQFSLGYTYSKFQNNLTSFSVANPFDAGDAIQRMSLAPSNDYHQINATGAYNFAKNTRLTSKFSYSIASQNDSFLPYSANLAVGAAGNVTPRTSLDGKVAKTLLDIALITKPIDKMNLKLGYQYHNSDNQTPIANYLYVSRDDNAVPVGAAAQRQSRRNAPLSTREHIFSLDGDYEIAPKTIMRAGLERKSVQYSMKDAQYENHADRDYTNTDKLNVELRRPIGTDVLGNVGYTRTERRGSEYDKNAYFRNTYWNPGATTGTNSPATRSFMYQDFDEDRVRASGNWTVSETVSLQAGADTYRRRAKGPNCNKVLDATLAAAVVGLPDTCLGRTLADGTNLSLDAQWQPEENLTTFAFFNFGESGTEQRGRSGGATNVTVANEWTANLQNRDHTLGLGLKWQPENFEKLDVGGTYVFNGGRGKTSIATGTGNTQSSMPDTQSKLHTLQLFAKWDYSKQIVWRFNYVYENLKSTDWAYDGLTPTSDGNILLSGQTAPRSSNHVFGVSAMIKNW